MATLMNSINSLVNQSLNTSMVTQTSASHTHTIPGSMKPKRRAIYDSFGLVERIQGGRRSTIDKKLTELIKRAKNGETANSFSLLMADDAIEVLGDYNPMYSGRPKALTMRLLEASAGQIRNNFLSSFCNTGLFYQTPSLTGVRAARMLTSHAGLTLLDHWAVKFPAFKPFVDAYVNPKMRKMISCDCFDMAQGKLPSWMEAEIEKNKERLVKWEARQYRKMKKEEEEKKLASQNALLSEAMRLQQLAQSQSMRPYYGDPSRLNNVVNGGTGGIYYSDSINTFTVR